MSTTLEKLKTAKSVEVITWSPVRVVLIRNGRDLMIIERDHRRYYVNGTAQMTRLSPQWALYLRSIKPKAIMDAELTIETPSSIL